MKNVYLKSSQTKGSTFAKAVIITAGVGAFEPRRLELPEAAEFEKTNLHYFVSDLSKFSGSKSAN